MSCPIGIFANPTESSRSRPRHAADLAAVLVQVTVFPPFSRAPLRRHSCALRTAGFCFFRTPPPKQVRGPFPKMQPLPWEQRASLSSAPCAPRERGRNGVTS